MYHWSPTEYRPFSGGTTITVTGEGFDNSMFILEMDRFPSLHSLKMNLYFKHQTPLLLEQLILVLKKVPTRIHTMMPLHIMKKVPQQVERQVRR